MPLRTLLVANRGEIACRVIRTARRMGLRTVAVYSDADQSALHVALADEAHHIGPAPARDSYLRADNIIAAAHTAGADAIHPGYGFLSENADFAEACAAARLAFIGPPPAAIRAMGSKSAAKTVMGQAGVPLVPGYHGADQEPAHLAAEAARIGYPVLIKASAGGGGKGMRAVTTPDDFAEALAAAQGEARAAFNDDQVLIERYLTRPRHIEIQVFADTLGNVVHLFERDCSVQRRHQKILEEAPAPGMTPARRAAMGEAACAAARAIDYVGAGTVEFIIDADRPDAFYFMEMNTRLQVEHPVTEAITGQDLVEWQIRVANGEPLPLLQPDLAISGHAVEARIYAEDPARDFVPSIGRLTWLRQPDTPETTPTTALHPTPDIRVDTGIRLGDEIGIHYDPMIAKLIAHAPTRDEALARLATALHQYEVVGVQTNLALLRAIATHPAFAAADLDTGFIARHPEVATPATATAPPLLALAAIAAAIFAEDAATAAAHDPWSPWSTATAWRLGPPASRDLTLRDADTSHLLRLHPQTPGTFRLEWNGAFHQVTRHDHHALTVDGARYRIPVIATPLPTPTLTAIIDGANHPFTLIDPLAPPTAETIGADRLLAPMPGLIVSVATTPGATVARGQILLVMEAMKVQMRLPAPRAGTIAAILVTPGDQVPGAAELIRFD